MSSTSAEEILIGYRHQSLAGLRSERVYAAGVFGIEEPRSLEVGHGVQGNLFIGLCSDDKSPSAIAGLHRLIGGGHNGVAFIERRALGIVNASRKFQRHPDGDVAIL